MYYIIFFPRKIGAQNFDWLFGVFAKRHTIHTIEAEIPGISGILIP